MSLQSGLRCYALSDITALAVTIGLVGTVHLRATRPVLAMLGVPCPVDNTTTEQVDALRTNRLVHLWAVKFAPARPVSGGFVLNATTPEKARQWAHENRIACENVKRDYSCLRCRDIGANEPGLADPPVSELWLSFGPNDHLIGVDVYRQDMSANDTTAAWGGVRHALRDVLGMPTSAMGDASPAVLDALPLRAARLQWRFSDYVAAITANSLPHTGLTVRK